MLYNIAGISAVWKAKAAMGLYTSSLLDFPFRVLCAMWRLSLVICFQQCECRSRFLLPSLSSGVLCFFSAFLSLSTLQRAPSVPFFRVHIDVLIYVIFSL